MGRDFVSGGMKHNNLRRCGAFDTGPFEDAARALFANDECRHCIFTASMIDITEAE